MATVQIDREICIADQLCAATAPDVFETGDDGLAYVREGMTDPEGADLDLAQEAELACPVEAITIGD